MREETTRAVAVTGVGVVSPIGIGRGPFWSALVAGRSGVAPLEAVRAATRLPTIGAEVRDFAARDFIAAANLRRMGKLARMIVAAARMALDDARLSSAEVSADRLGIAVGSALGDLGDSTVYLDKLYERGPAAASPLLFPNLVLNAAASYASLELGATGVNFTVAQGEVSGEAAIAQGCEAIRRGRADVVLAGGGDELSSILLEASFRARALSGQRGGREWCSPYDAGRNGLVFGEGAAMLALEAADRARSRGAPIVALIEADEMYAVATPPYDFPAAVPPERLRRLAGEGVDLVVGGANSTRRLDACELGVAAALAPAATLTSIKGASGEFGGAGALAVATACLALEAQTVPPLCHLHAPAPECRIRLAPATGEERELRRALVIGFARGGAVAGLSLRRA